MGKNDGNDTAKMRTTDDVGSARSTTRTFNISFDFYSIVTVFGLGLLLAWFFSQLCFEGVILSSPQRGLGGRHDPFFFASVSTIVVLGILSFLRPQLIRIPQPAWKNTLFLVLVVLLALAASALICFDSDLSLIGCVACGICAGIGFFFLLMRWFAYLVILDSNRVCSILLFVLLVAFSGLFFCIKTRLPTRIYLSLAFLVVSALCLIACLRYPITDDETTRTSPKTKGLIVKAACFSFTSAFASMLVWVFDVKVYESTLVDGLVNSNLDAYSYLISGLMVVVTFAILWVLSRKTTFLLLPFHRIMLFTLIMSIAMAIVGEHFFFMAYTLSHFAFFLSQVGMWMIFIRASYLFADSSLRYMPLMVAVQYLGYLAGFALFYVLRPVFFIEGWNMLLLIGALVLVSIVFLFVFTEKEIESVEFVVGKSSKGSFKLKCAKIQEQYGLSDRELEVFMLLAQGKNAITISEELFIAYSTVKTHKNNIYGKVGIHTQQELLTLVDNYRI